MAMGLLGPEEHVHMVNVLQVRAACRDFLRVLHKQDAPQALALIATITQLQQRATALTDEIVASDKLFIANPNPQQRVATYHFFPD